MLVERWVETNEGRRVREAMSGLSQALAGLRKAHHAVEHISNGQQRRDLIEVIYKHVDGMYEELGALMVKLERRAEPATQEQLETMRWMADALGHLGFFPRAAQATVS